MIFIYSKGILVITINGKKGSTFGAIGALPIELAIGV
jgi:hypothetical protein